MNHTRRFAVYLVAACMFFAGLYHFINPAFYLSIMPTFLPYASLLNYLSGLAEIVLAVGLLLPTAVRRWALWGLAVLMVLFLLVHIPHLMGNPPSIAQQVPHYLLLARLAVQFMLIRAFLAMSKW